MEYTILILALPVLSFLILGLTGMFMEASCSGADRNSLTGHSYRIELPHRYQLLYSATYCRRSIPNTDSVEHPVAAFHRLPSY